MVRVAVHDAVQWMRMSMSRFIMVALAAAECGDDEPQTSADVPSLTLGQITQALAQRSLRKSVVKNEG